MTNKQRKRLNKYLRTTFGTGVVALKMKSGATELFVQEPESLTESDTERINAHLGQIGCRLTRSKDWPHFIDIAPLPSPEALEAPWDHPAELLRCPAHDEPEVSRECFWPGKTTLIVFGCGCGTLDDGGGQSPMFFGNHEEGFEVAVEMEDQDNSWTSYYGYRSYLSSELDNPSDAALTMELAADLPDIPLCDDSPATVAGQLESPKSKESYPC